MFDINRVERRLSRLKRELSYYDLGDIIAEKYTARSGWSIGYIEGQIRVLEEVLDMMREGNDLDE